MVLYILLYLLYVIPVYCGVYQHATSAVFNHGLPDLGREIRQRIKTIAGPHAHIYRPVVAAPSKGYEVIEHHPIVEASQSSTSSKSASSSKKAEDHKSKGKKYRHKGDEKSSGHHSDHHSESAKKGHSGKENHSKKYADESGKKTDYEDKKGHSHEHHEEGKGGGGHGFKLGKLRDKGHVHKGFHDIYHKDERKKSDTFWSNNEESGKWYKYGSGKHKHHHDGGNKKAEKHEKESKEEDEYKKEKCTNCKKN